MELKFVVPDMAETLFVLFLMIVYSSLTPFSKDVVNTVIVIIGLALIIMMLCYIAIKKTIK